MQDFDYNLLAIGGLRLSRELGIRKGLKGKVSAEMPILTCPMQPQELMRVGMQGQDGCFGFGSMLFDDIEVMTIRLQIGGTQLYWLADMTDAELWRAMEKWRMHQFVPHVFEVDNGRGRDTAVVFGKSEISKEAPIIGKYRSRILAESPSEVWDKMTALAGSGWVQAQATTDISGVALEQVLVNVLVTKRYKRFVQGKLLRQKPLFATGGCAGAGNLH